MAESSGTLSGFECCSMCMRHCFEKHGDFGRQETVKLFSAPSFSSFVKQPHVTGRLLLRIPVLFIEKQNYNIGEKLLLRGPLGFECECTVQRQRNGYVLSADFYIFLVHHEIEAGDLLIFYLIAKCKFLVKVYDKFGVEKVLGTNNALTDVEAEGSLRETWEGVDEGSDEEALDRSLNLRRQRRGKEPAVWSGEETKGRSFSNVPGPSLDHAADIADRTEEPGASRDQDSFQKRELAAMPDTVRRGESNAERQEVISSFISGADEKKESALRQANAANALMAKHPDTSQLVFMKNSHVTHSKTVYLSKLPLPDKSDILTLVDDAGKQYTVKWTVPPDGRSRLASGWDQFVVDHKIAIDDACVFEVDGSHVLLVHIFRLVDFMNTENEQQEQDHRDDLQPSAVEQSISEERGSRQGQQSDSASAGLS